MARARGQILRISRAASSPFRSGIEKSRTATSGQRSRASRSASCPSPASATTAKPSRSSKALSPWRTIAWSSARRIRFGIVRLHRYGEDQLGSATRAGDDVERSADGVQALANPGEPETALAPSGQDGRHVESDAVVADDAAQEAAVPHELDV